MPILPLPQAHVSEISHVIQLAVAPVFLLTGVAATISALTMRIGRIVDRARVIERDLWQLDEEAAAAVREELRILARRSLWVNMAIALCTFCALLVTLLIALAFVDSFLAIDLSYAIAGMFILAMLSYSVGLYALLHEIALATQHVRFGAKHHGRRRSSGSA